MRGGVEVVDDVLTQARVPCEQGCQIVPDMASLAAAQLARLGREIGAQSGNPAL